MNKADIFSVIENGEELYNTSALARAVIEALLRGGDKLNIINTLLKHSIAIDKQLMNSISLNPEPVKFFMLKHESHDKIKQQMIDLKNNGDIEVRHKTADALLCDLLNTLGFNDIVKEFNELDKWYA